MNVEQSSVLNSNTASSIMHISFDGFIGKYKPKMAVSKALGGIQDFVLNVDDDEVSKQLLADPNKVWTYLVDGDGISWISSGHHLINREGYLISEVSWEDGQTIEAHDDIWIAKSKLVFMLSADVDSDEFAEQVEDACEELRSESETYGDIRTMETDAFPSGESTCLVVQLESLFEDNEPTKETLSELHNSFKSMCEKLRTENDGISLALHEELGLSLYWGHLTDKSTKFISCDLCGYTNQKNDWIDEGETCPKCKTVN